jgi:hypothetical protein
LFTACLAQVKGHIGKMAVCLEDSDPRIAALAQLFFHELAKKEYKVGGRGRAWWVGGEGLVDGWVGGWRRAGGWVHEAGKWVNEWVAVGGGWVGQVSVRFNAGASNGKVGLGRTRGWPACPNHSPTN